VVYSVESEFQRAHPGRQVEGGEPTPFWNVSEVLCTAGQPYDVVVFPEGRLRSDALRIDDLGQYATVIPPDCAFLTAAQAELLTQALAAGKRLVVPGRLGENLPSESRQSMLDHRGTIRLNTSDDRSIDELPLLPQSRVTPVCDLAINVQRVGGGAA